MTNVFKTLPPLTDQPMVYHYIYKYFVHYPIETVEDHMGQLRQYHSYFNEKLQHKKHIHVPHARRDRKRQTVIPTI